MRSILFLSSLILSGCAVLHHAQVGQIDNRSNAGVPFEVMLSETGVSVEDLSNIARATQSDAGKDIAAILAWIQMGPQTGNPVYTEGYAKNLISEIYKKCPSGQIVNLMSIRETRKYPVISGEIVKVTGICLSGKNLTAKLEQGN